VDRPASLETELRPEDEEVSGAVAGSGGVGKSSVARLGMLAHITSLATLAEHVEPDGQHSQPSKPHETPAHACLLSMLELSLGL
jgi:hypothetical protein